MESETIKPLKSLPNNVRDNVPGICYLWEAIRTPESCCLRLRTTLNSTGHCHHSSFAKSTVSASISIEQEVIVGSICYPEQSQHAFAGLTVFRCRMASQTLNPCAIYVRFFAIFFLSSVLICISVCSSVILYYQQAQPRPLSFPTFTNLPLT